MAVINKIKRDLYLPYSNENAAASFCRWIQNLFDHPEGYTVVLDQELRDPANRQLLPFPCLVVNQVDTSDPGRGFLGAGADQNSCLFYVYCMVHKNAAGSIRLLRRMKDQVVFALKRAGVFDDAAGDVVIPPIALLDFSTTPPGVLNSTLVMNNNIVQHFSDEDEIAQYELTVSLNYLVHDKMHGA